MKNEKWIINNMFLWNRRKFSLLQKYSTDDYDDRIGKEGEKREKGRGKDFIDIDYLLSAKYPPDFENNFGDDQEEGRLGRRDKDKNSNSNSSSNSNEGEGGDRREGKINIEDEELDILIDNLHFASRPSTNSRWERRAFIIYWERERGEHWWYRERVREESIDDKGKEGGWERIVLMIKGEMRAREKCIDGKEGEGEWRVLMIKGEKKSEEVEWNWVAKVTWSEIRRGSQWGWGKERKTERLRKMESDRVIKRAREE